MTEQEITEFIAWHEARMLELGYCAAIVAELRGYRTKFLAYAKKRGQK